MVIPVGGVMVMHACAHAWLHAGSEVHVWVGVGQTFLDVDVAIAREVMSSCYTER